MPINNKSVAEITNCRGVDTAAWMPMNINSNQSDDLSLNLIICQAI